MNGFICTKACTLGGIPYEAGDNIPAEAVLPSRIRALTKQGYIAPLTETAAAPPQTPQEEPPAPAPIVIPITKGGAVLELPVAPEGIVQAVTILQLNADKAAQAIAGVGQDEVLILIDTLEERKTVKSALVARAEELKKAAGANGDDQENKPPAAQAGQEGAQAPEGQSEGQEPGTDGNAAEGAGGGQEGQKPGDA